MRGMPLPPPPPPPPPPQVLHVKDRCLVSHTPNPQQCALRGGVWDDTNFDSFDGSGGSCLSKAEAVRWQQQHPDSELLQLRVSHDGQSR